MAYPKQTIPMGGHERTCYLRRRWREAAATLYCRSSQTILRRNCRPDGGDVGSRPSGSAGYGYCRGNSGRSCPEIPVALFTFSFFCLLSACSFHSSWTCRVLDHGLYLCIIMHSSSYYPIAKHFSHGFLLQIHPH